MPTTEAETICCEVCDHMITVVREMQDVGTYTYDLGLTLERHNWMLTETFILCPECSQDLKDFPK